MPEPAFAPGRKPKEVERFARYRRHREPTDLSRVAPGGTGILGPPPEGSTYQCVAIARSTGRRCTHWALRGQTRCHSHLAPGAARLDEARNGRAVSNRS